jgi:hypothetical protein
MVMNLTRFSTLLSTPFPKLAKLWGAAGNQGFSVLPLNVVFETSG